MFNATSGGMAPRRTTAVTRAALVAAMAAATVTLSPAAGSAQDWQTLSQSRKAAGEKNMKVDLEYAAGKLDIGPGTDGSLYKANLRYDADIFKHPVLAYSNGTLKLDLSEGSIKGRNMKAGKLDVELGTRVPLDLNITFGAAEAKIDLGGLQIQRAHIQTGASETKLYVSKLNQVVCEEAKFEVGAASFDAYGLGNLNADHISLDGGVGEINLDFSGESKRSMSADIKMGLGSLTIHMPRGAGLKVTKQGFLAAFDSQGLVKNGDSYYSQNWKSASRQITLNIQAAFGSIDVKWID